MFQPPFILSWLAVWLVEFVNNRKSIETVKTRIRAHLIETFNILQRCFDKVTVLALHPGRSILILFQKYTEDLAPISITNSERLTALYHGCARTLHHYLMSLIWIKTSNISKVTSPVYIEVVLYTITPKFTSCYLIDNLDRLRFCPCPWTRITFTKFWTLEHPIFY